MIKRSRADGGQAAVVNLENLAFVEVAAKNEVFVLECHSTGVVHFLPIELEIGRHLARSFNQPGRVAFHGIV